MNARVKRALTVLAVVALAAALVALALRSGSTPHAPLPNPNGYDDLVAAGGMIAGQLPEPAPAAQDLRSFVERNTNALDRARLGFSREIVAPLGWTAASATNQSRMDGLAGIKTLARLLRAQGRLAELEQKPELAVAAYLDLMKLGKGAMNGGVIVDGMVGVAVEEAGLAGLKELLPRLTPEQAQQIATELKRLRQGHETGETLLTRERQWAKAVFGWRWYLLNWTRPKAMSAAGMNLKGKLQKLVADQEQLIKAAEAQAQPR